MPDALSLARPQRARARPSARRGARGRTSLAVPLLVLGVLVLTSVHGLKARAAEEGFGWVDPAAIDVTRLAAWADPRWADELSNLLAGIAPFRVDDEPMLACLRDAIGGLSFVERVGQPEVVWPAGLCIPVTVREPVACVPVGRRYRTVAADGTLLSGLWPMPPRLGARWLPVLGPMSDAGGLFRAGRPGDFLAEPEHLAALDVACSMRAALSDEEQGALGPLVIDAGGLAAASVDEPGIRLLLEGGRTIWFGRAPSGDDPGELPAERKWSAVRRGVELLASADPERDWRLLDVRWDHAEIALTRPLIAAATPGRPARRGNARASAPDPSAPDPGLARGGQRGGPRVR